MCEKYAKSVQILLDWIEHAQFVLVPTATTLNVVYDVQIASKHVGTLQIDANTHDVHIFGTNWDGFVENVDDSLETIVKHIMGH